ncbi:MAG: CHAT domain-containing protein [Myxococcales bacterium]|nr:CHAT domain-containing protein [Myxococcales bacterium]
MRPLPWPLIGLAALLTLVACTPDQSPLDRAEAAYAAGQPADAIPHFQAALAGAQGAARPHIQARLGLARFKAGQAQEAEADLTAAIDDPLAAPLDVARARRYRATLWVRQGRTDPALADLEAAAAWFASQPAHADDLLKTRQVQAGLRWQRGELEAAFEAYQDLHGRAQVAGLAPVQAAGLEGMAMVLAYAGDGPAAQELLDTACGLHHDNPLQALHCRGNAAVVQTGAGDAAAGLKAALAVAEEAQAAGRAPVQAQALVTAAWARARLGQWTAARATAREAEALATGAGMPRQAVHAVLAELVAAAGERDWRDYEAKAARVREGLPPTDPGQAMLAALTAERHAGDPKARRAALEAAFKAFEGQREALDAGLMAAFLLPRRAATYHALLEARLAAGDVAGALDVLGAMKARTFTDRLRASARPSPDRRDLPPRPRVALALARATLGQRATPPAPAAASLAGLPADVVVVEHASLPDALLTFVTHKGRTTVHRAPVGSVALQGRARALVTALRSGGTWRDAAAAVAEAALDPALPELEAAQAAGARRLAWLPHGPLHAVPLEALPWGDGLVVDRLPVFSAPNLTALAHAQARPLRPRGANLLAVADALGDLPGARAEVGRLQRRYPNPTVLLGPQAGVAATRQAWRHASVLHFAVHGVRPDADTPAFLQLRDGALRAHEIATADLSAAQLAVLSVCDSARGQPNTGDEIVGVLDRAFLEAGVGAVVASRWPVHDAASVLFMDRLHQAWRAGRPVLEAFREAQLALRRGRLGPSALEPELVAALDQDRVRGVTPFRRQAPTDFSHPYFWAAFSLRGDPR